MKQIRKRLTYANVMSSLAVFLILGGATALAAVNKVGANEIKANSIKTGKIVKEAVTEGKLKNGAVTTNKLANGAVVSDKLADNSVTTAKIADNAVTTAKVANDAVTTAKVANDAVTAAKIANDAVTTGKIANDAVTGAKVNESTLGTVPSAASFAGATQELISFRANVGGGATLFSGAGLTLTASCTGAAPNVGVFKASTSTSDSSIWSSGFNTASDLDFDIGDSFDIAPTALNDAYEIIYQQGLNGTTVTAEIGIREFNNTPGNSDCQAIGRVLIG